MWLCKYDLSKECDGKYNDCVDCVLDEIRAEIPKLTCGDNECRQALVKVADVIKCIDKQRAEDNGAVKNTIDNGFNPML